MPKKAKKTPKIAVLSDSDDEEDFKNPRKKGHKFAISDSDDDDGSLPKPSTSKGKIRTNISVFEDGKSVTSLANCSFSVIEILD